MCDLKSSGYFKYLFFIPLETGRSELPSLCCSGYLTKSLYTAVLNTCLPLKILPKSVSAIVFTKKQNKKNERVYLLFSIALDGLSTNVMYD